MMIDFFTNGDSAQTTNLPIEYHSVCPLVRIGTTTFPLPQASVYPPQPKGRGHTRLRVRGGGSNSDDWRKSLALCLLCGIPYSSPEFLHILWKMFSRNVQNKNVFTVFRNHAVKISISYLSYLRGAFVPAEPSLKLSSLPHL
jgi:hypothetical protein